LPEGYIKMDFDLGEAYVKEGRLTAISKVDAVIFDCDGVLIDVRESYDKAIARATAWIFEALTGQRVPEDLLTSEVIFLFRRSGGFNNDCDIVYGLLMFLLSEMPPTLLNRLFEVIRTLKVEGNAAEKINAVKERINVGEAPIETINLIAKIEAFTFMLNETGIASVDRAILSLKNVPREAYDAIKSFLYGSKRVGEGVIATVFEELFYGPELFRRVHNIKPELFQSPGTIENSRIIVRFEALNRLTSLIGGAKFGIASGSPSAPAKQVLGSLLDLFDAGALVFLDNILEGEKEYSERGFLKVSLGKPNPYPLLKSAWSLEPFRAAVFVGDSIEDALAVERANRLDPRFISAGVYAYTGASERAMREFLKFGCDIISPSVNEIPSIIEAARRFPG